MPSGLVRLQQTGHLHFVTFTCYRRSNFLCEATACAVVLRCLENARLRYGMRIYGYVLMPEHIHLLVSEPERGTLARALQSLKSASARVGCLYADPQMACRDSSTGPSHCRSILLRSSRGRFLRVGYRVLCRKNVMSSFDPIPLPTLISRSIMLLQSTNSQ
jgi:REP element-mobilizing transposase RayT